MPKKNQKTLIIVESPAKAKTIAKFLDDNYSVKSSYGHIRDLPRYALGVDTEHDFKPQYVVSRDKSKLVKELRQAEKKADQIIFATDADREGEAISWHLAQVLNIKEDDIKRIVFHEITKSAILEAIKQPRQLDLKLVDAQQARRVLDRLVGYELSPFLWHKVAKGLSAGRVQSVAVRLVVEREREIQNFVPQEHWSLTGIFSPTDRNEPFSAELRQTGGKKLDKLGLKNKKQVDEIVAELKGANFKISAVEEKESGRQPHPPFTTSTLQQEANHRLGFSAKQTMRIAQQLYEGVELGGEGAVGLISYMRTDSLNLSEKFLADARQVIKETIGENYAASASRRFKTKSKNAQEAHEAIRPTEAGRTPESIKTHLDRNQFKLYDLIWRRALASQMAAAKIQNTAADVSSDRGHIFRATGLRVIFEGFLKLFPEKTKENELPKLAPEQKTECRELKPAQHFTEPPARFSDATLVKALEEHGIGRPSTYAPTIATIEERRYVKRDEKKRLFPTEIATLVNDLLVKHFPQIVDFRFTAKMEEDLDKIAAGEQEWTPIIAEFYHPFKELLKQKDAELSRKEITEEKTDEKCEKCGEPMIIKLGRYGKFLSCSAYPKCRNARPLAGEGKTAPPPAEPTGEKCDKCGADMVRRVGRYGPFLACSAYPKCKNIKNIEVKLDINCPKCGQGQMLERHSKRGKIFYGCSRYPDCDFALWDKPTGEFCPTCKAPMVFNRKGETACSNKKCGAEKSE